jgi:hypothetical protein
MTTRLPEEKGPLDGTTGSEFAQPLLFRVAFVWDRPITHGLTAALGCGPSCSCCVPGVPRTQAWACC